MERSKVISLPKLLTIGWSHTLFKRLSDALHHPGPVTLDFHGVDWAAPFGLTAVSLMLEKCLRQGKKVLFSPPINVEFRDYLERIGFKSLFMDGVKVKHGKTSVELRRLEGVDPGYSEALVELIAGNLRLSDDAKYEMKTHINELMTNSFDHSKARLGFYVCAQWYPKTQNLRISFADGGIGIFQSLKNSGKFHGIKNDAAAIRLAVKPGVTTRKNKVGGFGLAYIKKYARNNDGTLTIVSGRSKVNFYKDKIENKDEPVGFNGTIVDILVSPKKSPESVKRKPNDLF